MWILVQIYRQNMWKFIQFRMICSTCVTHPILEGGSGLLRPTPEMMEMGDLLHTDLFSEEYAFSLIGIKIVSRFFCRWKLNYKRTGYVPTWFIKVRISWHINTKNSTPHKSSKRGKTYPDHEEQIFADRTNICPNPRRKSNPHSPATAGRDACFCEAPMPCVSLYWRI